MQHGTTESGRVSGDHIERHRGHRHHERADQDDRPIAFQRTHNF